MRAQLLAVALAFAACTTAAPTAIGHQVAPLAPPTNPPPKLVLDDHEGLYFMGLPAVSEAGSVVAIGRAHSGMDGRLELEIILRDHLDRELAHRVVVGTTEPELSVDERARRYADANRWLAEQHRTYHLQPMRALRIVVADPQTGRRRAEGDGLTVDWQPSQLAISRGGAAPIVHATPAAWLELEHPRYRGSSDSCSNPAFLNAANADPERSILVVEIAYLAEDTCPEPAPRTYVVNY